MATALARVSIPLSRACLPSTPNLSSWRSKSACGRSKTADAPYLVCETLLLQGNRTELGGRKGRSPGTRGESALHIGNVQECKWSDVNPFAPVTPRSKWQTRREGKTATGSVECQVEKYTPGPQSSSEVTRHILDASVGPSALLSCPMPRPNPTSIDRPTLRSVLFEVGSQMSVLPGCAQL